MPILGKFVKQSADVIDLDVQFGAWLKAVGDDAPSSYTVIADPGITIGRTYLDSTTGTVKVWTSGGTDGEQYKITITLSTALGRVKQIEVVCRVKDT